MLINGLDDIADRDAIRKPFLSPFVSELFGYASAPENNQKNLMEVYFGKPVNVFSSTWFNIFFGSISQQHLEPLIRPVKLLSMVLPFIAYTGKILLLFSVLTWVLVVSSIFKRRQGKENIDNTELSKIYRYLIIYIVSILTIFINNYISQMTLYTQAKKCAKCNSYIVFLGF